MSQTESPQDEELVNYQLGVNDLDMSGSIADDEDVMEFDYEASAIFKRLADDIYESPEAGLREPLTNSITTSRRVMRSGECEDPVIKITVQDGEQQKLRLRDMGEGISKSVLKEVLLFIGRSTARDDGELSGQYGMGFLASYKLVGMNGGFIMYTNSRNSSEGPYRGLFKPGAFEPDTEGKIPPLLGDDEYGTVFEYFVRPDISISEIREWVENHAKYSPIPIIYKELDEDGEEQYNEDYYAPTLKDAYDDESPYLRVDTPYYEATTSPAADNDIVLISSPVDMYGTRALRKNLPWSVDLRIKYENGIVVDGPNEGLIPTTQKQYNMMEDERKDNYIPKEQLTEDDLTLPEATGTRERVRRHKKFLQHVNAQLHDKFLEVVEDTLDTFNPEDGMQNSTNMEKNVFLRIFTHFDDEEEYTKDDVKNKLESQYEYENPDEDILEFILAMAQKVSVISERKSFQSRYPREKAYSLYDDDSDVFMCVASNSWKAEAVNLSSHSTKVVKVNQASDYDAFEKHLGWTPLKNIKKSNVDEMLELTEEQVKDIRSKNKTTEKNIDEQQLTIHHASGGRNTLKRKSNSLVSRYKTVKVGNRTSRYGDILVLFPQGGEHKVSDNYHLADNRCCVATCSQKMVDYLTEEAEGIMTYNEYVEWVESQTLVTSTGLCYVSTLVNAKTPVLLTPKISPREELINNSSILSSISEYMQNNRGKYDEKPLYGIINKSLLKHIKSVYSYEETNSIDILQTTDSVSTDSLGNRFYGNEVKMYTKISLPEELYNSSEVSVIRELYDTVNEDVVSLVDKLKQASDLMDGSLSSMAETEEDESVRMPTVKTKYGQMPFDELENHVDYDSIILHIVEETELLSTFEEDSILENAGRKMRGIEYDNGTQTINTGYNSVYVPMLYTEYSRVSEHIPQEVTVINSRYNSRMNMNVYAAIKIRNWYNKDIINNMINNVYFDKFKHVVDSLKPLHDNGVNISETKETALNLAEKSMV